MPYTQLILLATSCALAVANIYYNQPLLSIIGNHFHKNPAQAGQIATVTQLGYAIGLFLIIPLGDRVNPRRLLTILPLFNIVSLFAVAFASDFSSLLVASFAIGISSVSAQIIIPTIAALIPARQRGHAIGILLSGLSAGILLARTLSGLIAGFFSWQTMFVLAAFFALIQIMITRRHIPESHPNATGSYLKLLISLWRLLKSEPELQQACFSGFFFFGAFSALWGTLSELLSQSPYQLNVQTIGLFGLLGIGGFISSSYIGRALDRKQDNQIILWAGAFAVLSAFLLIYAFSSDLWIIIAAILLLDIGNRAGMLANQHRIYQLSTQARNRRNTLFMVCYFLGGATGTAIANKAIEGNHWEAMALTGIIFIIPVLLTNFRFMTRL